MAGYVLWIYVFRYRGLLGEDDLYRMLVGLLDGARSGAYLASANQYGKAFSFGYIAALYRFADPRTLADPARLIGLINGLGFWSAAAGSLCLWLLARMLYGLRAATVAVMLFALSPMMLELGTSGHPILPAFALFAAGACCLVAPARGARGLFLSFAGAVLLLAGLTARAEVLLGFPFVVVARADFRGWPRFLKCAGQRAIAPALATGVFFALKWKFIDSTPGTGRLGPFLAEFIRWKEIPIGVLVLVLNCGIATAVAGAMAVGTMAGALRAAPAASAERTALLDLAIGPLALMAPALVFWIANPRPGRHFILCLAGVSMLAGGTIARRFGARTFAVYAVALGIVAGNQALGAVTGPLILMYAPSKLVVLPEHTRHLPRGFPTGTSWGYHRAHVAEQRKTDAFATRVEGVCDERTLVMSLDATQIFAGLYEASGAWSADEVKLRRFPVWEARINGRAVRVLSESEGWPVDAAADAMADPALSGYKLARDPDSISIYDRAEIPPDRAAHLGCSSGVRR
jgi:hypothetical protein